MENINNIIFDFGGVLIAVDYHKTIVEFQKLGIQNFDKQFSQAIQSHLFERFERGEISASQLRKEINNLSNYSLNDHQIDQAWNAMIGNYFKDIFKLLEEIKKHYRVFLLSNTNIIHYDFFIRAFQQEFKKPLESYFEKVYWSFKIGLRKPENAVFDYVINDSNLQKEKTLFIDDSIQHVQAAKKSGLKAYHLLNHQNVTRLFENNLLKSELIEAF